MISTADVATWAIAALATFGVIARPWNLPEFIWAAAEEMPADKYTFKPTATQWTYGKTIAHIVGGNTHVCAMLTTTPVPATIKAEESDSKEVLNTQLKASFDYCAKALDSFLLAALLIIVAVTVQMLQKYNPAKRQR